MIFPLNSLGDIAAATQADAGDRDDGDRDDGDRDAGRPSPGMANGFLIEKGK